MLTRLWKELKRRNVFRVVAMYAGTAFIVLQLVDIIAQPLQLPEWTMTLVIVLLGIGLLITLLIAWIYDITPDGIRKTESIETVKGRKSKIVPAKRGLKTSDIVIAAMAIVIVILLYPKIFKKDKFKDIKDADGRISVAVMPFQNMTNDTIWNVWQEGIQENLISSLSNNPEELKVRQIESVTGLLQDNGLTNYASITPSIASNISKKLDANVFVFGNIQQAGPIIRVNAQLMDSKKGEIIKAFQVGGASKEDMIFKISDSLSRLVKDFLVISKLEKEESPENRHLASTKSPEAYRNFIYGDNAFKKLDWPTAIKYFTQAIAIDSNFALANIRLTFAYGNQGMTDQVRKWGLKVYEKRDQMPLQQKIYANYVYAYYFGSRYEAIKYLKQLLEIDDQLPIIYYGLGINYNEMNQYDKAIPEFEKAIGIYNKWGSKPRWVPNYTDLGLAYHNTGQYKKEKELYLKAELDFPENPDIIFRQAILSLTEGDTLAAIEYLTKYISILKENSWTDEAITASLADIYSNAGILDKAEEYYHQALLSDPENPDRLYNIAYFLINKDRNITEGLMLIDKALHLKADNYSYLGCKGWGLFKQGNYNMALKLLEKSWELKPFYDHELYLHLQEAKKAVASTKN